ncbi:hypothetical protein V2O64_20610 [Verrucomicrobiaceae bacterium 227]
MDRERAKFILQSFRPDGADAREPAFQEALELATEDRELGEWLAGERAQDAAFAAMLSGVEIPIDLRDAIFDVLSGHGEAEAEFDSDFMGALASLRAPESLREEILGAMEVESKIVEMPKRHAIARTVKWVSSSVALLAMMAVVFVFFFGAGGNAIAGSTPREVERATIRMLESPFFALDLENDRPAAVYDWLKSQDLPVPEALPEGLKDLKAVGCRFLEVGEKKSRASLVCYRKGKKVLHLVTMKSEAVDSQKIQGMAQARKGCRDCDKKDEWAMTQWSHNGYTFFLLSKMEVEELAGVF